MNSNFIHIHTHNEYSFLDGYGKADKYISRAKELGQIAIALTNHGNVDGCLKFQEACKGKDIIPIFGAELYFVSDRFVKEKLEKRSHILIIAKNETGWINLLKLITISNLEGFHGRPRIDEDSLIANKEGLIVSTACSSSIINRPDGFELLTRLKEAFGEDLYAEIMPFDYAPQRETNLKAIDFANKLSLKILASNDCHYIYAEDSKLQEVLLAIQRNTKWKDPTRWKFDIDGLFLKSKREMIQSFISLGYIERSVYLDAIDNTEEIFDKCKDFSVVKIPVCLPEVPGYEKHDPVELFRTLVNTEYDRRKSEFGEFGSEEEYFDRKEEELNLIIDLGFSKYFIIIWELMSWCKENDILTGIGRGSVGGSLVAYLLGITSVDPIRYGLIFARFISPARIDLPDVDMDFEDSKRPLVRKHLEDLYGKYCVAGCSTFSSMQGRGALRDVSRIFEVPVSDVSKASASIVVRCLDGDSLVYTIDGPVKISSLVGKRNIRVSCVHGRRRVARRVADVFENDPVEMFEIELDSGKKIVCSKEHRFWTEKGWKKLKDIDQHLDKIFTCEFDEVYFRKR